MSRFLNCVLKSAVAAGLTMSFCGCSSSSEAEYDVAAYVWPAYHNDPRWAELGIFPEGDGEWETVRNAVPRYEGHRQPREPQWGYFNEADPKMQEKIIDTATKYGVNTFIFDWYWYEGRPFLEDVVNAFLQASNCDKMKFYLMWANHTANSYWDRLEPDKTKVYWRGETSRESFDMFTDHLIDDYFCRENYYTIDEKPVFAIYELGTFIDGMGGLEPARNALDGFRAKCVEKGLPGLHVQAILWNIPTNLPGVPGESESIGANVLSYLGIESLTHYQWVHYVPLKEYSQWGKEAVAIYDTVEDEFGLPYFPQVSVDWDNNPRFPYQVEAVTGVTPELFGGFLQNAKDYLDSHPDQPKLVTINAWNEWSEGSCLEPDTFYGNAFLKQVKKVFK